MLNSAPTRLRRPRVLGKDPIGWLFGTLKRRGFMGTVVVAWGVVLDYSFDLIHGTETVDRVLARDLETDSPNKIHATNYGATKARPFRRLMRRLQLPRDGVFVDIGSGKGRVLLLAGEHGFQKIIGIEFSAALCRQAGVNVEKFRKQKPFAGTVEIVQCDITAYELRGDEAIFFMFDPFGPVILAGLIEKIRASVRGNPRPIWLIYNSPAHHQCIEQSGLFRRSEVHEVNGNVFQVYSG